MTDELERRLRVGLHRADLPAAPESLRAALEHLPEAGGPMGTGRGARPMAHLLAAVASVVIVALLAVWLVPGHFLGPASPSPSGAVSSSPNPTVTSPGPTAPATAVGTLTWTPVTLPLGRAAAPGQPYAWGAFAGGYLLAGCPAGGTGSIIWYSADGRTWQQDSTTGQGFAADAVESFVPTPSGVLAVGTTLEPNARCMGAQPAQTIATVMWFSTDGRTWQRLSDAQLAAFTGALVDLVTEGPGGLIAFGYDNVATGNGPTREWYSQDGETWTTSTQFSTAFPDACPDSVAPLGRGFVAIGRSGCNETTGPQAQQTAAWFSADGHVWTEAVVPAATVPSTGATYVTLDGSAAGAVALLGPGGASPDRAMWITTDGRTWVVSPSSAIHFGDGEGTSAFFADQTRILALSKTPVPTGTPGGATAWSSADGAGWRSINEVGVPGGEFLAPSLGFPTSGTLGPNGVLAVTYELGVGSFHLWFGAWTPSPEQPARSPSLTPTPSGSSQLPPCQADQLTIALVDSSVAAGTEGGWLQFTDWGAPCSMQGWPSLVGVTAKGSTTTARDTDSELDFPAITSPPLVSLKQGDAAYAAFAGSDTQPGSRTCGPSYQSLRVAPPNGNASVVISAWLPYFNGYLPACAGIDITFVIPASAPQ